MATVRDSIDGSFATGRYADIQVDAQPYQDGVRHSFHHRNSWFIGDVTVKGAISSPPNVGQLENATRLELGPAYNDAKLAEAEAGQQRLLEFNGLYRGNIQPDLRLGNRPHLPAGEHSLRCRPAGRGRASPLPCCWAT